MSCSGSRCPANFFELHEELSLPHIPGYLGAQTCIAHDLLSRCGFPPLLVSAQNAVEVEIAKFHGVPSFKIEQIMRESDRLRINHRYQTACNQRSAVGAFNRLAGRSTFLRGCSGIP